MSLYRRKDSPSWWLKLPIPGEGGKALQISTGTANRRKAEAFEAKLKSPSDGSRPSSGPSRAVLGKRRSLGIWTMWPAGVALWMIAPCAASLDPELGGKAWARSTAI